MVKFLCKSGHKGQICEGPISKIHVQGILLCVELHAFNKLANLWDYAAILVVTYAI